MFELPPSPDATMSDERGAVRSFCDSRSKFFRGCQYTQSSYLQDSAVNNGGHREGRQRAVVFFRSSQAQRSRQRVPSPGDPASEKFVCDRDVQAHQARSSPRANQKAGLLTMSPIGPSLPKRGVRATSVFPPIATELRTWREVRKVPQGDSCAAAKAARQRSFR